MNSSRLAVPIVSLDTDFRRALSVARELGVGGIEIDGRYGIDLLTLSETGVRQIRKWLDDAGLQVAAVSFPTRRGYSDQDQLEARVGATKQMMLQAQRLGATVLLGRLGDIPAKEDSGNWQVLIDVLTDLGRTGQQAGAFFCAEAGQSSPEDLRQVIKAVPEGSLQVHLVTGALLVHGYDPAEAAMTLAADIGYVHATDAVAGAFAGHGRAVPLGTGQVDVPPVLAVLEERGYRGWVAVEAVSTHRAEATKELQAAVNQLVNEDLSNKI